jgi:hypothetical protein
MSNRLLIDKPLTWSILLAKMKEIMTHGQGGPEMRDVVVTTAVPEPVWLTLRRLAERDRMLGDGRASVSALVNRWIRDRVEQEREHPAGAAD